MRQSGIVVTSVSKTFRGVRGAKILAIADITLSVKSGRIGVLLGPSGSGKSTLLRIVAGLERPSSGTVVIDEILVTTPRPDVGLVFQRPVLLPWRTARENVRLPADVQGTTRAAAVETADALLARVGLGDFGDAFPAELSGGMQARVALARALSQDPATLLLDEPFAALDAITRIEVLEVLMSLWAERRRTMLFITHSIEEAITLADDIHILSPRPGQIVSTIPVEFARPRSADVMTSPAALDLAAAIRSKLMGHLSPVDI